MFHRKAGDLFGLSWLFVIPLVLAVMLAGSMQIGRAATIPGDARPTVQRHTPAVTNLRAQATHAPTIAKSAASPQAASSLPSLQQIIATAAGDSHTCGLTDGGTVKCWGANWSGQLGNNSTTDSFLPVDVSGVFSVTAIAAGDAFSCALTDGGVKCWGANESGQLGNGTTDDSLLPVAVGGLSGVTALAAGGSTACALVSGGGVKCWGANDAGQVGDGTTDARSAPTAVSGLASGVNAVDVGSYHACALLAGGGVKCWGSNDSGQLGDGTLDNSSIPVDVAGLANPATAISAGGFHTCAVAGGVVCWGGNYLAQLGDGSYDDSMTPVAVLGLESGVSALAAGVDHNCALTSAGGVKCWGDGYEGEFGNGLFTGVPDLVDVVGLAASVTSITSGQIHTCAVLDTGHVQCWGGNPFGQLGDGANNSHPLPATVETITDTFAFVDGGSSHTCGLTTGGGVKCWGLNEDGQLGDGTNTYRTVPTDVIGLDAGISALSVGAYHTCALTTGGGVKCWGANWWGALGDGSFDNSYTPIDVTGLGSGVVAISMGGYQSCALTTGGGVKCWGGNWRGQLGDGTNDDSPTPVDVVGLASGVSAISAGGNFTCALLTGGGVKCWGDNRYNQLGDGTTDQRDTPVDVSGLISGVQQISSGGYHACALSTLGGVKCWGDNYYYQMGDSPDESAPTPVDIASLASGVSRISAGGDMNCVLTDAGGVKCWGGNYAGQLGNGSYDDSPTVGDVTGLTSGVSHLETGWAHACVLKSDETLACWGDNMHGQLGLGTSVGQPVPVNVADWLRAFLPVMGRGSSVR